MEEQFVEFCVELDATGSVYEQLHIIAANLDSFMSYASGTDAYPPPLLPM
jgi:hypothetical protein